MSSGQGWTLARPAAGTSSAGRTLEVHVEVAPGGVIKIQTPHCDDWSEQLQVQQLVDWIIEQCGGTCSCHLMARTSPEEMAATKEQYIGLAIRAFRRRRGEVPAAVIDIGSRPRRTGRSDE